MIYQTDKTYPGCILCILCTQCIKKHIIARGDTTHPESMCPLYDFEYDDLWVTLKVTTSCDYIQYDYTTFTHLDTKTHSDWGA